MYRLIKSLLFILPPERAHYFTTGLMQVLFHLPLVRRVMKASLTYRDSRLEKEVFGITFPNPVGLAAGFDKDAAHIDLFDAMGFGFIEVGTVTPRPQDGNPKPRLFRLKSDRALINRMGFNNKGVEVMKRQLLKKRKSGVIIGGNIGKNKVTPNHDAVGDYLICLQELHDLVDYFTVNVSSPNTPGLRELQEKKPLQELLGAVVKANSERKSPKPILLKIAPDMTNEMLDDILDIVKTTKLDGIIATNTTIDRSGLKTSAGRLEQIGNGGLSGAPVFERSTEIVRYIRSKNPTLPIVAVGGISSPEEAQQKLDAGADLLQIYTGLVYEGPGLVKRINKSLAQRQG